MYFKKLIMLLLLSASIVGCSKEEVAPKYADLIVGKWYLMKLELDDGTTNYPANSCEKKTYYEFTKDKIFSSVVYTQTASSCKAYIEESGYSILEDEKKVFLSGFTSNAEIEIKFVSNQELSLYFPHAKATISFTKDL
jgi:hypothetical protein